MATLNIDRMPREEGFSVMRDLAARNSVPYAVFPIDASRPIAFEIHHQQLSDLVVTKVRAGNYGAARGDALVRRSEPRLILQVPKRPVATEQRGHQVISRPKSVVAMWSLDPLRTQIRMPATIDAVTVPLEKVALPQRVVRELMGRDLGASPFGTVVASFLAGLTRAELDETESEAAASPTVEFARLLLAAASGDDAAARRPLGETIGARIMLYLRSHVYDPELTADSVAERFSISRRYLYVILARMGISLGEWVRSERLTRAAEALRDPSQREVPVAMIGRSVGFADHSSFSRAFRERFGCTPSEWRDAGAHPSTSG
jgi:AraC-like DNA-binding protein